MLLKSFKTRGHEGKNLTIIQWFVQGMWQSSKESPLQLHFMWQNNLGSNVCDFIFLYYGNITWFIRLISKVAMNRLWVKD